MITLADARALIAAEVSPLAPVTVSLAEAAGSVLRQNVLAKEDVPAFDRSAMDGYAIDAGDSSEKFQIVAEIQPGAPSRRKLGRGECARIFTGAPIPTGTSQVLMQEHVRVEAGFMIPVERSAHRNIRDRGEDAKEGETLLRRGSRLGAGELALLASLGITRFKTSPRVRVVHFATGNELVAPDKKPRPGQIRDSNSTLVSALAQNFGGTIVKQERLEDDFDLLLKKTRTLKRSFDLLLVSGGASVGDYDFGKKLLTTLGYRTHFTAVNLRPGKPLVFATRGKQAAFILPGNPVSHLVTLHVAVRLAFERLLGLASSFRLAKVKLTEAFESKPVGRETFWPARVEIRNGELVARALRWQSSGDVTSLVGVNALLQLGANASGPKAGDCVSVMMIEAP